MQERNGYNEKNYFTFNCCVRYTKRLGMFIPAEIESLSVTGMYFDTVVTVEAWGTDRETLEHCWRCAELMNRC